MKNVMKDYVVLKIAVENAGGKGIGEIETDNVTLTHCEILIVQNILLPVSMIVRQNVLNRDNWLENIWLRIIIS